MRAGPPSHESSGDARRPGLSDSEPQPGAGPGPRRAHRPTVRLGLRRT